MPCIMLHNIMKYMTHVKYQYATILQEHVTGASYRPDRISFRAVTNK